MRLKLVRTVKKKKNGRERLDERKLRSEDIRKRYNIEVENRFQVFADIRRKSMTRL